jgi:hypothetical protein
VRGFAEFSVLIEEKLSCVVCGSRRWRVVVAELVWELAFRFLLCFGESDVEKWP